MQHTRFFPHRTLAPLVTCGSLPSAANIEKMGSSGTLPLILLIFILVQINGPVQCKSISSVEVDALLELKAGFIKLGDEKGLRGWNAGNTSSACEWEGVTCSGSGDHVEGINVAGFGLAGSLAPQLGNLSFISTLNLSSNSFTGLIPTQLARCASLKVLDLSSNEISGSIPPELGLLTNLELLILRQNNLTGDIPDELGLLTKLEYLSLATNDLTGVIPLSLVRNCTNLVELDLHYNHLGGSIPSELRLLPGLEYLILWQNNFTGHVPSSLTNCTNLLIVDIRSNPLGGTIPVELGALTRLSGLYLWANSLTGAIPSSLGNCTNLLDLEFDSNDLIGPIPTELGLLPRLRRLVLWGNNLVGLIPSSLGNCTDLFMLSVESNRLSGSIPTELGMLHLLGRLYLDQNHLSGLISQLHFRNFTNLLEFDFGFNQLTGTIPGAELGQLQQLQGLELAQNNLSKEIPWEHLTNCSSLFQLDLSHNHLSGGIPSSIEKLKALRKLYLQGNLLRGRIPDSIGNNLILLDVDLSFNRFTGSLPSNLAPALITLEQSFKLSHNDFSGSLPSWLGQLVNVQVIDFSDNNFFGTIPESLGECRGLTALYLSHNHLFGDLPLKLSNLSYLETLDLSSNNLTGALPSFLGSLSHLQFLNVSFNNFSGTIPALGVLKRLNASYFQGNPDLCGPIIQKQCIHISKKHHHNHLNWKVILVIALPLSGVGALLLLLAALLCYFHHHRFQKVEVFMSLGGPKRYTADELMEATQGYSEVNLLGEGGFSSVYKGVLSDDKIVAVKKLKDACSHEALLQEMQVLSKLRHRNLVRILGCVLNLEVKALVLEYMSNGSLEYYLHHDGEESYGLSWEMLMRIAIGIANGLIYLHHDYDVPIIHGDVKPSNILLDSDLEAHLGDFGLAKLTNPDKGGTVSISSNFKGCIGYMAPEYAYTARITTKVDVHSYGVVILEMLTRKRPTQVPGVSLREWVQFQFLHRGGVEEVLEPSLCCDTSSSITNKNMAWQLIQMGLACTEDHPNDRPTMKQVLAILLKIKRDHAVRSG